MIKKHQDFFNLLQLSFDVVVLSVAYATAVIVKSTDCLYHGGWTDLVQMLWMVPLLVVTYRMMDMYTPMRGRRFRKEAFMLVRAHLVGISLLFSLLFLHKEPFSREISVLFAVLGLFLLLLERFLVRGSLRFLRSKGYNQKHILIVGGGWLGREFLDKVRLHRNLGYNIVGFLDDDQPSGSEVSGKPVLGPCSLLADMLEDGAVDEVVVALPLKAYGRYGDIINACEKSGVRIRIIPDYHPFVTTGVPEIMDFDGIPVLNVHKVSLDDPSSRCVKRAFDLVVSAVAIVITAPVMVLIGIGIKLTSPGPLLFRQQRIGLNNRPFDMLKFRSMHVSNEETASTTWTTANDPRKTRFGSFLRKTSLDELPQFFNVLTGDMSVIGPRPERPFFVDQFKEEIPQYMLKHQIKPGITGWAQVNGLRGDTSIKKRIEYDLYYIKNWKLLLDVKIMFLTFFRGLVNKNAY